MFSKYYTIVSIAVCAPTLATAQNYFDVMSLTCTEKQGSTVYNAAVDFPVGGDAAVIRNAKEWIGEVLMSDIDMPEVSMSGISTDDFGKLLDALAKDFVKNNEGSRRRIEITWMYEDPTCVTYEATTTDRDSVDWSTTSVACFSKQDGHRVTANEIFNCDEAQIKRLMWRYRGNQTMEVAKADDLYVGDCGYIDGWVLVVGPAQGTSGAAYRLRYPEIEQWLKKAKGDGYLAP